MKHHFLICILFLIHFIPSIAQENHTENVFIITLDGMRWQEIFRGPSPVLMKKHRFVRNCKSLNDKYYNPNYEYSRRQLMPFLWNTVVKEGQIIGNRDLNCTMNLTNHYWFSYPGYNEILSGINRDFLISTNQKRYNPNENVLEIIKNQNDKYSTIAVFGSWDVFPYIINNQRNGIIVNSGYGKATGDNLSEKEKWLNEMEEMIPGRWESVRYDAFTNLYALEYIRKIHPKVVYIGYGETDDFAHEGHYDDYLNAANRNDKFIAQLWNLVQTDSIYRQKTTFIITTDHGRGNNSRSWKSHGPQCRHSDEVWMAILGPDTPASGEIKNSPRYFTNQIAATILDLLNIDFEIEKGNGKVMSGVIDKKHFKDLVVSTNK